MLSQEPVVRVGIRYFGSFTEPIHRSVRVVQDQDLVVVVRDPVVHRYVTPVARSHYCRLNSYCVKTLRIHNKVTYSCY